MTASVTLAPVVAADSERLLAWRRRWEALLLGAIFLAITALSALLVASPRRVLVMLPLVAALAGVGASWAWVELDGRRRPPRGRRSQTV